MSECFWNADNCDLIPSEGNPDLSFMQLLMDASRSRHPSSQLDSGLDRCSISSDNQTKQAGNRVIELLGQSTWKTEHPAAFEGESFKNRANLTLEQKLDVYKTTNPGFIQRITGLSEAEFFKKHGTAYEAAAKRDIQPVTIGDLRKAYAAIPKGNSTSGSVEIVTGLDSLKLVLSKASAGSICQVASQFNGLESVNQDKATLSSYAGDFTQGPRSVMPCLNELLKRQVSNFNAFDKLLSAEDRDKFLKNGYVQWGTNPEAFLQKIRGKSDELQILAMVAKPELSDHSVMQVYAAAPPTDAYSNGGDKKIQQQIARELVVAQYEALAMMSVIRAAKTGKPVDLNVTLVGGGVFGNDPGVLNEALTKLMDIVKNHPVRVSIHAYNPSEIDKYPILKNLPKLNSNQFLERTR